MPADRQDIAVTAEAGRKQHHRAVYRLGNHSGQRRAPYAHGRRAEPPENQHPVQEYVRADSGNGSPERNPYSARTAEQGGHRK